MLTDAFQPAMLGPVQLRNRIIKAATFEGRTPDALVTDELIEFHRGVAEGGAGLTTVAYCAVAPEGRTDRHQIWMRPEAVPGLRRLTDAVHEAGGAVSAQLGHAGPVANAASNRAPALAPSRQFSPISLRLTHAATAADIRRIIAAHAKAARLAVESGFDAVELHFGHNYLISSFLSPALNKRSDEYGGPLIRRAELARQTADAVRQEVGDEIAVLAKFNMDDGVRGGFTGDESLSVATWLARDGNLDALELTVGSSLRNPMYLFRGDVPLQEFAAQFPQPQRLGIRLAGRRFLRTYPFREAYLLDTALRFRAELNLPLVLLGGIASRAAVDTAMSHGFDFVAMARALLYDPHLVTRMSTEPSATSPCTHCNRCMPTIYRGTHCVLTSPNPSTTN
ncbi:2,4-dienoyl-CoA reductase-like NADH-dependent reductase (Old Yellow Enzyme family) [Nocardia tenerifensis]|uniref:2,4-dienoyl-CoA reductase-like NADH-dependent reductase (Old Yellow Enzyme family) n=1 Tax=Nocardia tenerifensis TaxID=228006 RepID=A0A318KLU1_9NOCA|nr:NADH:flavin oxidoreductase [Nocardia tenerifensis]PXX62975.1 2,4-dienoyl-CoA reductase-like NADH-dependent reductase (Old Yellow Enzyme family) [Nocardia tenerifensis]